jgi:hypothetical protein
MAETATFREGLVFRSPGGVTGRQPRHLPARTVQSTPPLAHAGQLAIQTSSAIPGTIAPLVRLVPRVTESHSVIIFRSLPQDLETGAVAVALSMALREVEVDVGWEDPARDRLI